MPPESWFVLVVAPVILLLGVACPLAAWLGFKRRQARLEHLSKGDSSN